MTHVPQLLNGKISALPRPPWWTAHETDTRIHRSPSASPRTFLSPDHTATSHPFANRTRACASSVVSSSIGVRIPPPSVFFSQFRSVARSTLLVLVELWFGIGRREIYLYGNGEGSRSVPAAQTCCVSSFSILGVSATGSFSFAMPSPPHARSHIRRKLHELFRSETDYVCMGMSRRVLTSRWLLLILMLMGKYRGMRNGCSRRVGTQVRLGVRVGVSRGVTWWSGWSVLMYG